MFISFTDNHIFIIAERYISILIFLNLEIIRLPVCFFIFFIDIHQWVIWRPPESEKRAAFSIYHQVSEIILCTECKILVNDSTCIQFMKITECIFCFLCHRSIDNIAFFIYPSLWAGMKLIKHRIYRIAGTGASNKIRITDKTYRVFPFRSSHSIFCKSFYDIKRIVQRLRFLKTKLIHPGFSKPQKSRSMVRNCFRNRHQLSVKPSRIQKITAIAFKHLFYPGSRTVFINITQIFYKIIFHQFFQRFAVRNHQHIRQGLIFHKNIDKLIVAVFSFHIHIIILNIQHLTEISGISIILIRISFRKIRIICSAHLPQCIRHKFRICFIWTLCCFLPFF